MFLLAMNRRRGDWISAFGALSERWGGRRGAATLGMAISLLGAPLLVWSSSYGGLLLGAWMMGFFAAGAWGIVPQFLSERFPTEVRGVGTGFAYHAGVGVGSYALYLIGSLQDNGMTLGTAMFWCIAVGCAFVIALLWLGPETRGRSLDGV